MSKNNIIIFGSVGVNRGDDLMNRVIVNACLNAGVVPIVASVDPLFIEKQYGVRAISSSKTNLLGWIKEIACSKCVIIGGGTIVQNDFGKSKLSGIIMYAVMVTLIAKLIFRKKTIIVGAGVNKVNKLNSYVAKIFNYVDVVLVRDDASIQNANNIGLTNNLIKFYDIGLCKSLYDKAKSNVKHDFNTNEKYVCISLAKERNENQAMAAAECSIAHAIINSMSVKLIAMDIRASEELSLYEELKSKYEKIIGITIITPNTPFELLELVQNSTQCVGMRLHFCVLCLASGISPIVISREQKTEWIASYINRNRIIDINDQELCKKLTSALNDNENSKLNNEAISELNVIDGKIQKCLDTLVRGDHEICCTR